MDNLSQNIYLYNDAAEAFTGRWDGVDYTIEREPLEIARGVAEHWQRAHKDAQLRIEDVPEEVIEKRAVKNPLEDNDRGTAFAGLKRPGRRPKASGE